MKSVGLPLAWVLLRPELTAAIVGVRHPARIDGTGRGVENHLSPETLRTVEILRSQRSRALSLSS